LVTDSEIQLAAKMIRDGGLVAFPTETVYGLGANALDANAVASIFEMKGRPRFDPLIVHVAGTADLMGLVENIPEMAQELIAKFWPGPLSVVLPKRALVPDIVTAGLASVAVRCPGHDVALRLISEAGVPIAAPSANRFGGVSPTSAAHVAEQFQHQLAHILDAGPCSIGVESTVVSFMEPQPLLLRPGGVTLEEIEAIIGPISIGKTDDVSPSSPGQLTRHYSPSTRLILTDDEDIAVHGERIGLLTLQAPTSRGQFEAVEVLSEKGCLREAATNLFAALRRLDLLPLDCIIARPVPAVGLGRAIMDRLQRAAAPPDPKPDVGSMPSH
jgi:L-threonylcarbamoyladenylate synthase